MFLLEQIHFAQNLVNAPLDLYRTAIGRETQAGGIAQRPVYRQPDMHDIILGHIAQHGLVQRIVLIEIVAVEQHLALGSAGKAAEGVHQRAFARAAASHQGYELARQDRHRNVVQDDFASPLVGDAPHETHPIEPHVLGVAVLAHRPAGVIAKDKRTDLNLFTGPERV